MFSKYRLLFVPLFALLLLFLAGNTSAYEAAKDGSRDLPTKPNGAAQMQAPLLHTDNANVIPGQYIVVIKDQPGKSTAAAASSSAQREVRRMGGSIVHNYNHAITGFSARMSANAVEALRKNPNVAYIEADQTVQVNVTWGLDRVDQRNLPLDNSYSPSNNGSGVDAYIIDTGVRSTHNEFGNRVVGGYTAINDGRGYEDCNGHGTHVAGTVGGNQYGVANGVTLYAIRVLDCNGSGSNSGVIAGVNWVASHHTGNNPAVANMSLGGGASSALDSAVNSAINDGVFFAVAAGNDYAQNACNYSPARVAAAYTVGSTTNSDARSNFSNVGTCLDIFAPGSNITSAWYQNNSQTNTISGTSMATPHVAGAAALYLAANNSASPSAVSNYLTSNATSGVLSDVRSGSPNLLLFVGNGGSTPDPDPTPDPTPACSGTEFSGYLSGTGAQSFEPNGTYYYSGSGVQSATLDGAGSDFDLYLWKWSGGRWQTVASSLSADSTEEITYNGSSGYYTWRVYSYSGAGSYDICLDTPVH
ncbi:MAG TPA: S8 family peptidase [Anaerolineae bacterium]|nr:S8 family peptidase [Anaerolineae bacterium]